MRWVCASKKIIHGLIRLIYPKVCLVCKKNLEDSAVGNLVCLNCWSKIKKNRPPFCHRCGKSLDKKSFAKNVCVSCLRKPLQFDRAFSPCIYEGTIKELIHQFKYNNKDYLGPLLAGLMVDFIREYEIPMDLLDLIIPIPLYASRRRQREFNQAQVLSNYIAKTFNKMMLCETLIRKRNTQTQTGLEPHERFSNVRESFAIRNGNDLKSKNVLLIDDVLTTGATSSEAAFTLKKAGAAIVFVLTLAS